MERAMSRDYARTKQSIEAEQQSLVQVYFMKRNVSRILLKNEVLCWNVELSFISWLFYWFNYNLAIFELMLNLTGCQFTAVDNLKFRVD